MTASLIWLASASRKRISKLQTLTVNAIVLKEVKYGESDVILTLLSAEKGLITASAKGVLKLTSKNRPAVQLFCYSEFELTASAGRHTVRTALLKEQFFGIRDDVEKYSLACYIAEAAMHFCYEENNETDALRVVLNTLAALNKKDCKPLWQIKAAYELKLCSVCGFMPELDFCGSCGEVCDEKNSFAVDGKYVFSVSESVLLCGNCAKKQGNGYEKPYSIKLPAAVLYAARFVTASPIERFLSFRLDIDIAEDFANLCERYILYLAERNFETLKFYKSITSNTIYT